MRVQNDFGVVVVSPYVASLCRDAFEEGSVFLGWVMSSFVLHDATNRPRDSADDALLHVQALAIEPQYPSLCVRVKILGN